MTCSRCGRAASPTDVRCLDCGTPLGASPDEATSAGASAPDGLAPGTSPVLASDGESWPAPGRDFGARYRVIELLGAGGMGAVYHAWDKTAEVDVALKVIRAPHASDTRATRSLEQRLKRELLLARQVTHKNVVRIHDLGEVDGIPYITMPYVRGENLARILSEQSRLSLDATT